jgi:hypothetical protein
MKRDALYEVIDALASADRSLMELATSYIAWDNMRWSSESAEKLVSWRQRIAALADHAMRG